MFNCVRYQEKLEAFKKRAEKRVKVEAPKPIPVFEPSLDKLDLKAKIDLPGLRRKQTLALNQLREERLLSLLHPQSSWQGVVDQWKYRITLSRGNASVLVRFDRSVL